jgi:hypothetical protein
LLKKEAVDPKWKNSPEYKVLDLAFLAIPKAPVNYQEFKKNPDPLCLNYLNRLGYLIHKDTGEYDSMFRLNYPFLENSVTLCLTPIIRENAIKLLNELVGTPNFLTEPDNKSPLLLNSSNAFIDPNHAMVSNDFKIAIEAWTAVLAHKPNRPRRGSRKKLIEDWLENNYPKIPSEAKKRIATLLNPDKNGGAPPTT